MRYLRHHVAVQTPSTQMHARGRRRNGRWEQQRVVVARSSYSARIQRFILDAPALETPEGMTASRQLSIVEAFWKAMKNEQAAGAKRRPPPVVVEAAAAGRRLGEDGEVEFDVCICGGILGVMLGLSLVMRGQRVCIVEKRAVEGRRQEWNISRHDLDVLVRLGLLTAGEVSSCVVTQWEQDRIAFKGEPNDMYIEGALDLGVDPQRLIGLFKARYLRLGGTVLDHHMFQKAHVYDDGVRVALKGFNVGGDADWNAGDMNRGSSSGDDEEGSGRGGSSDGSDGGNSGSGSSRLWVTCRLVVDCMGHYSPIVKQQRHGQPVEGMVIVVGGCMAATEAENGTATEKDTETVAPGCDLLVTIDDSQDDMQYFWEVGIDLDRRARTRPDSLTRATRFARSPGLSGRGRQVQDRLHVCLR